MSSLEVVGPNVLRPSLVESVEFMSVWEEMASDKSSSTVDGISGCRDPHPTRPRLERREPFSVPVPTPLLCSSSALPATPLRYDTIESRLYEAGFGAKSPP